ncbi:MAG: response regulator [Gemmatimonadales bacterium]
MTSQVSNILLVEDDPTTLEHFRRVLEHEPALRVATATNGREGLVLAREIKPDLIISDYQMPEMNGFEFCRQVKADPNLAGCLFVVLSGFTDTALKVKGLNLGVDDYLTKPIDIPELLARVRASLRLKRLQDELRGDRDEIQQLHGQLERSFDQLLHLLIQFVDQGLPGAAERGRKLGDLATKLAERFDVPAELRTDLTIAAKLAEIGHVVDAAHHVAGTPDQPTWHHAVVSAALLEQVERLKGAAELIRWTSENWDGTGQPDHLVSGQIPLRSRLLRIAGDFLTLVTPGADRVALTPQQAIDEMAPYSATWYDPLALVHLSSVVLDRPKEEWESTRFAVAVDQLQVGMVLAADVSTSGGVKLLAKGATISESVLHVIQRRHAADPIIEAVWVKRK